MLECQAYGCQDRAGDGSVKGEIFLNANKFHAKRKLAMKWLHNIFNFNRKMVCQDHVTIDLEHRLLGLGERQLVDDDTVSTEFVHRKKSAGPSSVAVAHEERSRKRRT